jgi:hypothetical protein
MWVIAPHFHPAAITVVPETMPLDLLDSRSCATLWLHRAAWLSARSCLWNFHVLQSKELRGCETARLPRGAA